MSLNTLNAPLDAPGVDHYTPLSRAVASIDRDAYASRFAIYDRAHKALLRRLATAEQPPSDADIEREEQAFREAVRRVEFADELAEEADSPTLAPTHEPVGVEALRELRRDAPWPEVRARRDELDEPDAPDAASLPGFEGNEPDIALNSLTSHREPRSVMRRVGERLVLAVLALALGGAWLWIAEGRQQANDPSAPRGAATSEAVETPAVDAKPAGKASGPGWLSPEIFYSPPPIPRAPRPDAAPPARKP